MVNINRTTGSSPDLHWSLLMENTFSRHLICTGVWDAWRRIKIYGVTVLRNHDPSHITEYGDYKYLTRPPAPKSADPRLLAMFKERSSMCVPRGGSVCTDMHKKGQGSKQLELNPGTNKRTRQQRSEENTHHVSMSQDDFKDLLLARLSIADCVYACMHRLGSSFAYNPANSLYYRINIPMHLERPSHPLIIEAIKGMSDPEKYRKMSYIECVAREGSDIMIAAGIALVQMYNVTFHTYLGKVVFEFENKHKMKHAIITSNRDGNFHMEPHRKGEEPVEGNHRVINFNSEEWRVVSSWTIGHTTKGLDKN